MSYYDNKHVLVTGGNGLIGSALVLHLLSEGARVRVACRTQPHNLPERVDAVLGDLCTREACDRAANGIDFVFHLAASGGGLAGNVGRQAQLLMDNVLMNTHMLQAAHEAGVERYLYTSSSSVYPQGLSVLVEDIPWYAEPHPSERDFGWSKRLGELQARSYFEHYGFPVAIVRPVNAYGPRDDLDVNTSHVIPALLQKARSGASPMTVWGSGRAVRSFVHTADVARCMAMALEKLACCDPVNIGGEVASIGELARMVVEVTGANVDLHFDTTKPEGVACRIPSLEKVQRVLGFTAQLGLREGLRDTLAWLKSTT